MEPLLGGNAPPLFTYRVYTSPHGYVKALGSPLAPLNKGGTGVAICLEVVKAPLSKSPFLRGI